MKQYFLTEIITKDQVVHQGVYHHPAKKSDIAILWIHGLASTFYGNIPLLDAFTAACDEHGYGFASFNNRGHDVVTGPKKLDETSAKGYIRISGGAGKEHFEDCAQDIEAGISFLASQGYKKIILAGHSTGANKACYYAGATNDDRVAGVVLAGPMSDRLGTSIPKISYLLMKLCITFGFGDTLLKPKGSVFSLTPKRFLSLFQKGSTEDLFDYGDKRPRLKEFQRIRKPVMVIIGERDEYADRPVGDILKVFDSRHRATIYKSIIVQGANHRFEGAEKKFVEEVARWIQSI